MRHRHRQAWIRQRRRLRRDLTPGQRPLRRLKEPLSGIDPAAQPSVKGNNEPVRDASAVDRMAAGQALTNPAALQITGAAVGAAAFASGQRTRVNARRGADGVREEMRRWRMSGVAGLAWARLRLPVEPYSRWRRDNLRVQ